ncbi:PTPRF interacting protein binding protein, variant 2 [Chamberlinius hualienensis]
MADALSSVYADLQEHFKRLEKEKDTLSLQVSVLNEQIEAQADKIRDLESGLSMKQEQLENFEEMMQRSLTKLESQKLDLLSEISNLKLRVALADKEKLEVEERARKAELKSISLKTRLVQKERELATLRAQMDGQPVTLIEVGSVDGDKKEFEKPPLSPRKMFQHSGSPNLKHDSNLILSSVGSKPGSVAKSLNDEKLITHSDDASSKLPLALLRHEIDAYGTIPRNPGRFGSGYLETASCHGSLHPDVPDRLQKSKPSGLSFGKGFFWLKSGKRSCSTPNLGPGGDSVAPKPNLIYQSSQSTQLPNEKLLAFCDQKVKNKSLKTLVSKLKRSNSHHLEKDQLGEFTRGGIRSTAGPRLGWSQGPKSLHREPDVPFFQWDAGRIANWFHEIGLSAYTVECRRWVKNGEQLLQAEAHQLEKELGLKNPLHRKKLQLALQDISSGGIDPSSKLDCTWVMHWLDDIGLPQYKDVFNENKMDGRMLNYCTMDDLSFLKVVNLLHYISLKRGIEVLRQHHFAPGCLKRRPLPEESITRPRVLDVALWTNHRVMEWLRSIDLSEYAPNLRGSGVHGALMVYEPRFNAELLATLLSIPLNKTLLRRHLSTHFKELVGKEMFKAKRDCESSPNYVVININDRIKPQKRNQFTILKKKSKNTIDQNDYVCPMNNYKETISTAGSEGCSLDSVKV